LSSDLSILATLAVPAILAIQLIQVHSREFAAKAFVFVFVFVFAFAVAVALAFGFVFPLLPVAYGLLPMFFSILR